jgi:tetratricopeptide (TPR) repeat protein
MMPVSMSAGVRQRLPLYLFAGGATFVACSLIVLGISRAPAIFSHAAGVESSPLVASEEALPPDALMSRADRAFSAGDLLAAVELYERALEQGGGVFVMRRLFDASLLLGDRDTAESALGLLSFHGVSESTIDALRGMLLLREGEFERARALFAADPHRSEQAFGLLLLHVLRGEHDEAKKQLLILMQSSDPLLVHRASAIQGAYDEFSLFEDGKESHRQTLLARGLSEIGQYALSRMLLREVVREEPEYRDAWILLGISHLMVQDQSGALSSFESAYAIDPEKAETQYFLGLTEERLGNIEKARTYFGFALQNGFEPKRLVREKLAALAESSGFLAEAAEQYSALLREGESGGAVAHAYVTLLIEQLDDYGEARAVSLRQRDVIGDVPEILDCIGWTALLIGNLDEAATFLNAATTQDPTFAPAWFHRAMLEEQVGSIGQAAASYRKAYDLSIGIDPDLAARAAEKHNALL